MRDANDIWASELVNAAARIADELCFAGMHRRVETSFAAIGQTYQLIVQPVEPPPAAVVAGQTPDTAGQSPAAGETS